MDSLENRLIVHRASRTERLAEELIARLHAERPAHPLAPQTIVIPHLGMRRWLLQTIAKSTPRGIAANFDTPLPWQWLQRVAHRVLGDDALVGGDYNVDTLRWHVFNALPAIRHSVVQNYLEGADATRRRFQLAAHLADVFSQYLVYRADLILAWERGADANDWQANLWRAVRAKISTPHRAQRKDALVVALIARGDGESLPLHVFGVSHLAPDVLDCLRAAAAHRDVHLYFPDPCREHWDYIQKKRNVLATNDAESLYFEVGHPLLASLGRMGQDFSLALDAADDHRDPLDERDAPETCANLLDAVQNSIRYLDPELARRATQSVLDTSLRVHAVHTRVRELEVLKDQLLGFLADDATLQPRDIVVMAPDIAAYAPCLPAVFGRAAQYDTDPSHIPWHLADVALANTHPLFAGFDKVLDLGESRFRVSDVFDLLDVPAIARGFNLDDAALDQIEPWLRQSHVAWGLDARMKEDVGAAPVRENTWAFAFDRMYAGFVTGDDADGALVDGILPLSGVSGNDVDAIGRLDRLIESLRDIRAEFAVDRSLASWSLWLLDVLDAMFAVDRRDDAEDDAMNALRRAIGSLTDQDDANAGENLPWRIVRDVLRGALGKISERQPFLLGGITFCGLVPQRSIPFRIVCLLGMNEGEYPRTNADGGLNRMASHPRRGDRDTRNEDRYLFLEALMAARQVLHISYIGEDVNDGSRRNPASALSELLEFIDEQTGAADDAARTWLIRHPLQPFDKRYFTTSHDARLFSFERAYAVEKSDDRRLPFVDDKPDSAMIEVADVALKSLHMFWRNPSRATLRDRFGIGLDALGDTALVDSEPLTPALERRDRFEAQCLDRAWRERKFELPTTPPDWLARSGALPAGEIGARAYARLRARVQPMIDAMREVLGDDAERVGISIDINIDGARLVGVVDRVYRDNNGRLHLIDTKPDGVADFRDLIPFYVDYAALQIAKIEVTPNFFECAEKKGVGAPALLPSITSQDESQLRHGLSELIRLPRDTANSPLFFFPKTTWCWANAADDKRDTEARKSWQGSGPRSKGERDYEPSYAALVARDSDFLRRGSTRHDDFVATSRWVAGVLDPQNAQLARRAQGDA